jgi:SAM-dependent methyltransferase
MGAGYGRDLAEAHQAVFGHIAREAASFVLGMLGPAGSGRLVVDLGCGPGTLARALTDAGYDVLGVDLSEDMLRLARRTAPAARFVRASLLDAEVPACACVTAVGEAVNYAFDERAGPAALRRLFARVHRALEPSGVFVFDSAGPGRAGPGGRTEGWRDTTDWAVRSEATRHGPWLRRDITVFRRDGEVWRRTDEEHVLRLYREERVAAWLADAGFRVTVRRSYGSSKLPGWAVFVARMPKGR